MAWKKLNTPDIHAVKFYPGKNILKARLKSGHLETYGQVSEARYHELIAAGHPHDTDTFFSNIIQPNRISSRVTLSGKARRLLKFLGYALVILAVFVLFGLWNSGILDAYFYGLFPPQR